MDPAEALQAVAVRPRLPTDVVVRARLERRLLPPAAFTLVRGPAGSGKSVLLRQLTDRMPDATIVWIDASALPLTSEMFWESVANQVGAAEASDVTRRLQSEGPTVVVLDDAHLVCEPGILSELIAVADAVAELFVFIGTRRQLPLLEGTEQRIGLDVRVVKPDELRMTADEVGAFFDIAQDDAERLHRATQGYAALLRAVRAGELPVPGSGGMSGPVAHVVRRYVRRFLDDAGPDGEAFLLRTALTEDFTRAEAVALSGDGDAAQLIEHTEEAGLLLRADGDGDEVFRYPRLVHEVLRDEAQALGASRIEQLHGMIAGQRERRGDLAGAFSHALSAREYDQASRILLVGGTDLIVNTPYEPFAAVPLRVAAHHPLLAAARGLKENARGSRWTAQEFLAAAAIASRSTALRNLPERAVMAVLESAGFRMRGRNGEAITAARKALKLIGRLGLDSVLGDQVYMLMSVCAATFYRCGAEAELRQVLDRVPTALGAVPGAMSCGSMRVLLAAQGGDLRAFEAQEQALLAVGWPQQSFRSYRGSLYQLALMLRDLGRADTTAARGRAEALSEHMPTLEYRVLFAAAEGLAELIDGRPEDALRVVETIRSQEAASGRLSPRDDHLLVLVEVLALAARSRMGEAYSRWETVAKESAVARIVGAHLALVSGDTEGAATLLASAQVVSATSTRIGRARLWLLSWLGLVVDDHAAARSSLLAAAEMEEVYGEDGSLMLLPAEIRFRLDALIEDDPSPASDATRRQLRADLPAPFRVGAQHPRLTPRERVVLSTLAEHRTVADVAAALGISPNTAKAQLRSAYRKLGATNRAEALVRMALLGIGFTGEG